MIPREHGAWGILLTSYLIGWGAGALWRGGDLLLGLAALPSLVFLFLAQEPFMVLGRWWLAGKGSRALAARAPGWLLLWAGLGAGFGVPLLWPLHRFDLVPLGGAAVLFAFFHLWAGARGGERSHASEILGGVAIPLAAPAAWALTTGVLGGEAAALWVLSSLYFVGPVFYVKMRVEGMRFKGKALLPPERWRKGLPSLVWWGLSVGVAGGAGALGLAPRWSALAYLPALAKILGGVAKLETPPPIRTIGWNEAVHALAFGLLLVLAGRL